MRSMRAIWPSVFLQMGGEGFGEIAARRGFRHFRQRLDQLLLAAQHVGEKIFKDVLYGFEFHCLSPFEYTRYLTKPP